MKTDVENNQEARFAGKAVKSSETENWRIKALRWNSIVCDLIVVIVCLIECKFFAVLWGDQFTITRLVSLIDSTPINRADPVTGSMDGDVTIATASFAFNIALSLLSAALCFVFTKAVIAMMKEKFRW